MNENRIGLFMAFANKWKQKLTSRIHQIFRMEGLRYMYLYLSV